MGAPWMADTDEMPDQGAALAPVDHVAGRLPQGEEDAVEVHAG